jgi:hypothetical protein
MIDPFAKVTHHAKCFVSSGRASTPTMPLLIFRPGLRALDQSP